MADAVRIGMLGIGGFGLFSLQQFQRMPAVRVTAIAGAHPDKYARLAAEYAIPHHPARWQELVTHPDVDLVYIATPPYLHAEQAIAAAEAGKHIFCEKPLALTLAEADAMLAAAARHDVRLSLNFVMRYSRIYELVGEILTAGVLGDPQRLLFDNTAGDLPPGHWFWDSAQSGGIPVEHGVHFFDIFRQLFGPAAVRWAEASRRATGEEDRWLAVLHYRDRLTGVFCHAFDMPGPIERTWAVIDCARGRLQFDGWIPETLSLTGAVDASGAARLAAWLPGTVVAPLDARWWAGGGERMLPLRVDAHFAAGEKTEIYGAAVRAALADFIAWTRDERYTPRVTGADGRAALELALQVRAAAQLS